MKKKTLFIFLLALLPSLGFSQISIDSLEVYSNGYFVDSVYVAGTSSGQSLERAEFYTTNATCSPLYITYFFEGCDLNTPTPFDTMLVVNRTSAVAYSFATWDTSTTCPSLTAPTTTDTAEWFNCFSTNTTNLSFTETIHLYPNPAQHTVQLELPADIQVQRLSLSDVSGRVLRQYGPQQRSLEVTGLPPGLYFLRIESDRGAVVKRLVVE